MPATIQASTACDPPVLGDAIETCGQLIAAGTPNLFRLMINPEVAKVCSLLSAWLEQQWPARAAAEYQFFFANSREEALSGAIKLARSLHAEEVDTVIVDRAQLWPGFAAACVTGQEAGEVTFLPRVTSEDSTEADAVTGPLAAGKIVAFSAKEWPTVSAAWQPPRNDRPPQAIAWLDRELPLSLNDPPATSPPDIVLLDESFADYRVPWAAFAAPRCWMDAWNRRGMTTFHSTTFQPNTISAAQVVKTFARHLPEFTAKHAERLQQLDEDPNLRKRVFAAGYSPSLAKLTTTVGWDRATITARGHDVQIDERTLFDGVAGVACSLRGHNPPELLHELAELPSGEACWPEIETRLHELTGLPRCLPAVSGAAAIEHALKLALVVQFPRRRVVALQGGFGGKTLFALTGTWRQKLRRGIEPLYPHVTFVDPFATDACQQLDAAFAEEPVAVVQMELVQGVGGVRAIPDDVLQHVQTLRDRHRCLLLVDEVQTGFFRTGPFARSQDVCVTPDLLTVGKAASDMLFPFSLTLYSDAIAAALAEREVTLPQWIAQRYAYPTGMQIVLNTLRRTDPHAIRQRVRSRGEYFAKELTRQLRGHRSVSEVRAFGLLIGIELSQRSWWRRKTRRTASRLALLAMLKHAKFPLLTGFCQYDPAVLKFTPPLSVSEDELSQAAATMADVLRRPFPRLVASGLKTMLTRK